MCSRAVQQYFDFEGLRLLQAVQFTVSEVKAWRA
jgi:hypothetical protein